MKTFQYSRKQIQLSIKITEGPRANRGGVIEVVFLGQLRFGFSLANKGK